MKKLVSTVVFLSLFPISAFAAGSPDNITLSTYYPSPFGSYEFIRLVPTSSHDSDTSCQPGSFYVNLSYKLQFCGNGGTWGNVSGGSSGSTTSLWEIGRNDESERHIYLKDGVTNPSVKVGIGTKTPEFKLHLKGDGGILSEGMWGFGNIANRSPHTSGAGTRLFWYSTVAAFRAGRVDANQWDVGNLGHCSFALGYNTYGPGRYSVSLGKSASATSPPPAPVDMTANSVAIGTSAQALAKASYAIGVSAVANALGTFAIGHGSNAMGQYSTATGYVAKTTIAAAQATAIGYNVTANAPYSTAMGRYVTVTGNSSFGIGLNNSSWTLSLVNTMAVMGGRTVIGAVSPDLQLTSEANGIMAQGIFNTGDTLPVLGQGTRLFWYPKKAAFRAGYVSGNQWEDASVGNYSVAMGNSTTASQTNSIAMGSGSTASGIGAVAMGLSCQATGTSSTAIGNQSSATRDNALALGNSPQAQGIWSAAIGKGAYASGTNAIALGGGRAEGTNSITFGSDITVTGDHSMGINMGSTSVTVAQNNTFAIMGGKVGIDSLTPGSPLAVKNLAVSATVNPSLKYDPASGAFYYDTSSKKYKKNIVPLTDDWSKVLNIEPKVFIDRSNHQPGMGVIAEEVDAAGLKNLVIYDEKEQVSGFKYDKLPLYMLPVMKDQDEDLRMLESIVKPRK